MKLSHKYFATVWAFWFDVGTVTAYFAKWSVITRTSFVLLLSGSIDKKSIQTSSSGSVVKMFTKDAAHSGKVFLHIHQLHVFTLFSTSDAILGQ